MLRKLTAVALCATSLVVASDKQTMVASRYLMAHCQKHNVMHDNNGFKVNGRRLLAYDIDPSLRDIKSLQELKGSKLLVNGARYKLERHQQLNGGGLWGATAGCWIGKATVSVVCHGSILLVSLGATAIGGPALGFAVGTSLESTLGASIEAASMAGAVAGGIAGGIATGPV